MVADHRHDQRQYFDANSLPNGDDHLYLDGQQSRWLRNNRSGDRDRGRRKYSHHRIFGGSLLHLRDTKNCHHYRILGREFQFNRRTRD